ncbi:MAG: hypothetical protein IBJ07_14810 [Rhizobiaceae bacterium]|nr:hypothetical protein [Rhizobiaceae bacterium]
MVAADITRIAYDYSQRLELKRMAIEAWADALFVACDAEWASHQPRRSIFQRIPPPRREVADQSMMPRLGIGQPWYRTLERWPHLAAQDSG